MENIDYQSARYYGCVKWYNDKSGYGFIKVFHAPDFLNGADLFAHNKALNVDEHQHKYLVQGEYVEFSIQSIMKNGVDTYSAGRITGICENNLMCETRSQMKQQKEQYYVEHPRNDNTSLSSNIVLSDTTSTYHASKEPRNMSRPTKIVSQRTTKQSGGKWTYTNPT